MISMDMGLDVGNTELFDQANPESFLYDESNPSINLPSKVLFPVIASDVIAAIEFSKVHKVEISIKNSGHHYGGASQKKNTLLLNMNHYTQYSPTGIVDCEVSLLDGFSIAEDLSNQACALSLAKDKSAYVRVGGGENWDKVYRAVQKANKAQEQEGGGYKYHVVGGGGGTVSPLGWTFLAGLSGTTGGRKYGFGADQVLQVEMVLPNGHHVRFGPTEWEDAEGFIVPRTIDVSGMCRSNPEEQDEEKWQWGSCPDEFDVDFNDLWFAVRGGGGGTWGVVLSLYLQLHEYEKYERYAVSPAEDCAALGITPSGLWLEFQITYALTPSSIDVTKEHSNACGTPQTPNYHCYGEEDVEQGWARFLVKKNVTDLPDGACLVKTASDSGWKDFIDGAIAGSEGTRYEGHAGDGISPMGMTQTASILIPSAWIEASEDNFKTLLQRFGVPYLAFGGGARTASDQANSVSKAHRDAGGWPLASNTDAFWGEFFPQMYDISDKTNFPAVFGANHAGSTPSGPRKDNWTEPCPKEWTFEKRSEECISMQESIYGTKLLKRLEAIKEVVDPNYMLDCAYCIGNNRPKAKAVQDDAGVAEDEKDGTSSSTPINDGDISGAFSMGKNQPMIVFAGWIGLLQFQYMLN
mmetsp:Transcript_8477/g.10697  ORF Transcript_8477/g.10697 Transcript_8477/m.10697 type:complete len:636 (-) Transcript_8477:263-2170(-)